MNPRQLSIVDYDGVQFYVDTRLDEFRPVNNPHEHIPFDSEQGAIMVEAFFDALMNTLRPEEMAEMMNKEDDSII